MSEVTDRVANVVRTAVAEDRGVDLSSLSVGHGTELVEELEVDSLAAVDIIIRLEDEFDVSLEDDLIVSGVTVSDLAQAVAHAPSRS